MKQDGFRRFPQFPCEKPARFRGIRGLVGAASIRSFVSFHRALWRTMAAENPLNCPLVPAGTRRNRQQHGHSRRKRSDYDGERPGMLRQKRPDPQQREYSPHRPRHNFAGKHELREDSRETQCKQRSCNRRVRYTRENPFAHPSILFGSRAYAADAGVASSFSRRGAAIAPGDHEIGERWASAFRALVPEPTTSATMQMDPS
jgi:hypothetical protein